MFEEFGEEEEIQKDVDGDEEDDEEMKRVHAEWIAEFDQDSGNETDDEEDDEDEHGNGNGKSEKDGNYWERRRKNMTENIDGHEHNNNMDYNQEASSTTSFEESSDDCLNSPFDIDVNWWYGGHISSVDSYHRNQIKEKNSPNYYYSSQSYSHSLLPSLEIQDYQVDQIVCSQFEISHMILLMYNGISSDIFTQTTTKNSSLFSLTPTCARLRIVDLSSSTLLNFIKWFLHFGNQIESVRFQLFDSNSPLNRFEFDQEEPSSAFLHQIVGPITATLRDIFQTFQSHLLKLESKIPESSCEENEILPGHLTLIQLYFQMRPWSQIFDTTIVGITNTLSRISSPIDFSDLFSYFPLLKIEDPHCFENQDFIHHINVSSMLASLLSGLGHAHLISSHLSTVSVNSSLHSLGKELTSCETSLRTFPSHLSFQNVCLPCFTSMAGAYLKQFFIWIFQNEKQQTNSKFSKNNSHYSSQTHFGGLAYDHSLSSFPSKQSSTVSLSSAQMIRKFNCFPSLWRPLLTFGTMTKVNIQVLVKNGIGRSLRSSLLREFVSVAEKATLAYQSLLQSSSITISLPFVNIFHDISEELLFEENQPFPAQDSKAHNNLSSNLQLFTSSAGKCNMLSTSQIIHFPSSPSSTTSSAPVISTPTSLSLTADIPKPIYEVCELFPDVSFLFSEFCLEPLSDTLFISQQHAIHALIGANDSKKQQSFDLIRHLEFARKIFLLGDPLVYDPLFEYLHLQRQMKYSYSNSLKKHSAKLITDDLLASIEQNIHAILPSSLTESHVLVTERYHPTADGKENTQISFEKTAALYHLLDSINVEIHYTPPLSDIFTPEVLSSYNNCLSLLLKLQSCIWSGEILWKQVISSSSSAIQQHGYSSHNTIPTETTFMSYRDITRSCVSGLHTLLHILRSLRHFYIHEIHNVCWVTLVEFLSSSSCNCVEELLISHENYLMKIQSLLAFLRPKIEEILQRGFKSILSLGDMNAFLETEKQASLYTRDSNDDNGGGGGGGGGSGRGGDAEDPRYHSQQLMDTKFKQLFKEFNGMMIEIHSFSKTIIEICTRSPMAAPADQDTRLLSNEGAYYYANALRMLIGF